VAYLFLVRSVRAFAALFALWCGDPSPFPLEVTGTKIIGSLNGIELIRYEDGKSALLDGGIVLVCEEGLIMTDEVKVISV
jgi:hypothetical protein